jgi:hypothetical protein
VHNLVVNSKLTTLIIDDQYADGATAVRKGIRQALEQVALVQDRQALLDITRLGHGDDTAIIADVQDTVLLEDGAKHVLHNDRRARVADEAALLVQLLGEEVHAEVAVLAGLGRGGDADDLARAALQDEQVADADVVARDGDGVGRAGGVEARGTAGLARGRHGDLAVLDYDVFVTLDGWVVRVVVLGGGLAVEDAVSCAVKTVAEAVVVAVFVVISHVKAVLALPGWVDGPGLGHLDLLVVGDGLTLSVAGVGVVTRVGALVLPAAVLGLGCVDAGLSYVSAGGVAGVVMAVVSGVDAAVPVVNTVLDVNLGVAVALVRLTVAGGGP